MPDSVARCTRVLHIVGSMNRGGVETWLMNVYRNIDRQAYQFDFLVATEGIGDFDDDIVSLGGRVLSVGSPRTIWKYVRNLRRQVKLNGPYDVMHSHVHHFSGVTLALAWMLGIPIRIAHSHSDTSCEQSRAPWYRKLYFRTMESLVKRASTVMLAGSAESAVSLFGDRWAESANIFYTAIDLEPFKISGDPKHLGCDLDIASDAYVVGHVGRFCPVKNHEFIVQIAKEIRKLADNVVFLLVGDGPLRSKIESEVAQEGLSNMFTFAGLRPDVPSLMLEMDAFILPSHYEGLPMVGIEAQAAGLPCLFSSSVTREVSVVRNLSHFLRIESAELWAQQILQLQLQSNASDRACALSQVEASPFNIVYGVKQLGKYYVSD